MYKPTVGFEPTTLGLEVLRAIQLRHAGLLELSFFTLPTN